MLNKNINYKLVDTAGQITAVVFDALKSNRYTPVSNYLMNLDSRIEQVVFIEKKQIRTMGNELCINGSLAGAYLLKQAKLKISGIDKSIVYIISNNNKFANKRYLDKLATKYSVPASGIIFFNRNEIKPLVYVKDTDSLVWENACGSGSLAYFIFSGVKKIKQPSSKLIIMSKNKKYFTIKVGVKIVI
ncbi:MAG: hypothetical protein AAB535_00960 [Patescibacteria group bacterium]